MGLPMADRATTSAPLFEGAEWDFETIQRCYDAIERVALNDLELDVYPGLERIGRSA